MPNLQSLRDSIIRLMPNESESTDSVISGAEAYSLWFTEWQRKAYLHVLSQIDVQLSWATKRDLSM